MGGHDAPEWPVTIDRNGRSRWTGIPSYRTLRMQRRETACGRRPSDTSSIAGRGRVAVLIYVGIESILWELLQKSPVAISLSGRIGEALRWQEQSRYAG